MKKKIKKKASTTNLRFVWHLKVASVLILLLPTMNEKDGPYKGIIYVHQLGLEKKKDLQNLWQSLELCLLYEIGYNLHFVNYSKLLAEID